MQHILSALLKPLLRGALGQIYKVNPPNDSPKQRIPDQEIKNEKPISHPLYGTCLYLKASKFG
jgi:hypothetical protein